MRRSGAAALPGVRGFAIRPAVAAFDRLLRYAALAALLATAVSFLGRVGWVPELFTHFRFQFLVAALLLAACALLRRRPVTLMAAAAVGAVNLVPLLPYVLAAPPAAEAAQAGIRIMTANVSYRNSNYRALLRQVHEADPDVLALVEVDPAWIEGLSVLESEFTWTVLRPKDGPWGLALYSKVPVRELAASPYVESGVQTSIALGLEIEAVPVTLVLAHVRAPTSPGSARLRNVQLARLADFLRADESAARILLGDLNSTPWSPYYRDFVSAAALRNAARGFGYRATWPAALGPFGIPIDHCLVSDGLRVRTFRTGAPFGSDHLPVVVELAPAADGMARAE